MENRFINKEVSWLSFNERVLQEAEDKRNLLGDRIKFVGIFSSNQDEFFRVRVAMLKKFCLMSRNSRRYLAEDPEEVMHDVQRIVKQQRIRSEQIYRELIEELKEEKIFILQQKELSYDQHQYVLDYFYNHVRPQIFPMIIDSRLDFPYLKDNSLYLAVELRKKGKDAVRYSIIEIPTRELPRFIKLPHSGDETHIILIDEIVRVGLPSIYAVHNFDSYHSYNFKITRDAELEIDEDDISISYLNKISEGVKKRKEGGIIRIVHDEKMPLKMLNLFIKKNKIHRLDTLSAGGRYHKLKDFLSFPSVAGLETTSLNPPFRHASIDQKKRIFNSIKKDDMLLYFPYHTFSTIIDFIRDASIDPSVESIKVTLYRVAKFSSIANALINARRNRKEVTVLLELQARFDEENNIYWANRLKNEGVKVLFGISGLKVHSKLCLVTRREKKELVRYCSIGTGNMNEDTAKLYTDCNLLTANQDICAEVSNLFDFLERNINYSGIFNHLLVSPINARKKLIEMIDHEIKQAKKGQPAWIKIKINNMADKELADKLYEASSAGVIIKIICRSRFIMKTGIEGLSSNIKAISIIDKYLEHARFCIFHHSGDNLTYIGSADWQTRNIDRRVEVTCPIYRKRLKQKLEDIFDIQWKDNYKARILEPEMKNNLVPQQNNEKVIRSQDAVYQYLLDNNIP
ncbi:MAG: polyphosphate kinase 1 [Spirochaetales bacterium]|uniref:Polyphosphate kinase n=1 Tax=Candidatus Thalassospirochaeta sargassi TaxID=3119039 RepID=A0AAJ1MM26_9SPIO|nr:polyphosphate kinase 1 [Spirochaetales bacterium]